MQTREDPQQEATDAVMGAFPEAEIVLVKEDEELCIHFRFPGCSGIASWNFGDDNVTPDKQDEQAWLAYRKACKQRPTCTEAIP